MNSKLYIQGIIFLLLFAFCGLNFYRTAKVERKIHEIEFFTPPPLKAEDLPDPPDWGNETPMRHYSEAIESEEELWAGSDDYPRMR